MARPPRARQPIKDAALELFVERGVAGTGIREIARRANCSEAALYRHWTNKDDLVANLYQEHLDEVIELINQAASSGNDLASRIHNAVSVCYQLYDERPLVFRFVLGQRHASSQHLPDDAAMPQDAIEALLGTAIVDEHQRRLAAAAALGTFLQVAEYVHYGRLPGPLSPYADDVATLILRLANGA